MKARRRSTANGQASHLWDTELEGYLSTDTHNGHTDEGYWARGPSPLTTMTRRHAPTRATYSSTTATPTAATTTTTTSTTPLRAPVRPRARDTPTQPPHPRRPVPRQPATPRRGLQAGCDRRAHSHAGNRARHRRQQQQRPERRRRRIPHPARASIMAWPSPRPPATTRRPPETPPRQTNLQIPRNPAVRPPATPIRRRADPSLPPNELAKIQAPPPARRPGLPPNAKASPAPTTPAARRSPRRPHPTLTSRSPPAPRRAAADRLCSQEAHAAATATTRPEPARHPATPGSAIRFTTTTRPPRGKMTTPTSQPRPACPLAPTHPPHRPTRKRHRPPDRCRYPAEHRATRPRRPRRRSHRSRPCVKHRTHPHTSDLRRAGEPPTR